MGIAPGRGHGGAGWLRRAASAWSGGTTSGVRKGAGIDGNPGKVRPWLRELAEAWGATVAAGKSRQAPAWAPALTDNPRTVVAEQLPVARPVSEKPLPSPAFLHRLLPPLALAAASACVCAAPPAPVEPVIPVTDEMLDADAATPGDILSSGLGPRGQRHSPLKQLDRATVGALRVAWAFSFGGEKQRAQQSQPLVHDGRLFVTGSYSRLYAIDAKTGRKLWKYEHRLPEGIMPCCDVGNRGAALYGRLVIFGTLDAQLVALDQATGEVVWRERIDDHAAGYSYTAAPLIAGGLLLTGLAGGEFGVLGRVEARDPTTGRLVWTRPTVEGHMGYRYDKDGKRQEAGTSGTAGTTWPGDLWKHGGAAPWLGGTYDPTTGLAYFGTGNPSPWNSHLRPGDNLYSCSTVALDAKTGRIVWHYQNTPNDAWDYDGVNEFVLFDGPDGRRLGAKADRNGFFYVHDAAGGKLVNAFPFVEKITWANGIDLASGRPKLVPESRPGDPMKVSQRAKNLIGRVIPSFAEERPGKVFAAPAMIGAKSQMPMAWSPETRLFYVPSNEWGMDIWNVPVTYRKGSSYLGGGFLVKPVHDDHVGVLRAIEPISGRVVWEQRHELPLWGGVLTTAGRLVFWGTPDGFLKAADADSGKVLWQFQTGSGIVAPPVTWLQDGEQYVAVVSGWGGGASMWPGELLRKVAPIEQGGTLFVFKLDAASAAPTAAAR